MEIGQRKLPSYYTVTPSDIRYDKRVGGNPKILYGEIKVLCNKSGYCWSNNAHFAKLYNVTSRTIQQWIKTLKKYDYITTEVVNNNTRYLRIVEINGKEKK